MRSVKAAFTLLICALLLGEILACHSTGKFNKRERYYRNGNYRRFYGKRSTKALESLETSARPKYELLINTSCGDLMCDRVSNYPDEAIAKALKELEQAWKERLVSEKLEPLVMRFLSEHLTRPDEFGVDRPEIVYEHAKGCKAYGEVTWPQEGYSNDDGQIYYIVNLPSFRQKSNHLTCKRSNTECGEDIELPATYFRTCQQVHRQEDFLVLPSNSSQYSLHDFTVRAFLVPNGCKCILLHTGDYDFLKSF